ncbi:MAG: glycosyltransferase [Lewinellaceae bacterium]|nr:glycosyltransferase [Lewinellaceae bacterium]
MIKILCIGPLWRGSNAGALFRALSRCGHFTEVVDEFYHLPLRPRQFITRLGGKLLRPWYTQDFNQAILSQAHKFQPDLCLVYKGAFVQPNTLEALRNRNISLANFYPDVSFHTHGSLLRKTLPLYDFVFTTKTFGLADMEKQLGITRSGFIPHGFDPEIHRPIPAGAIPKDFFCDVSFIGTWSLKKETLLAEVAQALPEINIKIWGSQWEKASNRILAPHIIGTEVSGDLYAAAISASKINLGLLSEQVKGASSGDLITSRTFHIPGSGGFLLHERNEESIQYFEERREAVFFRDAGELVEKIKYYLENDSERVQIKRAGRVRAQKDHSLDRRAEQLIEILKDEAII